MFTKPIIKLVVPLLALSSVALVLAAEDEKESQAQSITIAELKDHIFFLASDFMAGRNTGSKEYKIAAEYGASQFRAAGLQPIATDSDGKKVFLQEFPLVKKKLGIRNKVSILSDRGESSFNIGDKCLILSPGKLGDKVTLDFQPVFVGYGIQEPEAGWDDYEGMDVEGKMVLACFGAPKRDGKPLLPGEKHRLYSALDGAGVVKRIEIAREQGAAAILLVPNLQVGMLWNMIKDQIGEERISSPSPDAESILGGDITTVLIHPDLVNEIFRDTGFDPLSYQKTHNLEEYKRFQIKDKTIRCQMEMDVTDISCFNAVGYLPGTDPELAGQYITIGAHLDHVGTQRGRVFNGADDNASGSVGVLEIAEAVALDPPRRPVIFILYGAEEKGLLGSRYFVNNCPVPLEQIMVSINMDMIGRTAPALKKDRAIYSLGSDKIDPKLKEILLAVNGRTVNWPLELKDPMRYFRQSDHYPYHQRGIPTVMFWSGLHPDLHRPTDDPEKIEFDKTQKVAQLIYELVMELGNRDEPLSKAAGKQ